MVCIRPRRWSAQEQCWATDGRRRTPSNSFSISRQTLGENLKTRRELPSFHVLSESVARSSSLACARGWGTQIGCKDMSRRPGRWKSRLSGLQMKWAATHFISTTHPPTLSAPSPTPSPVSTTTKPTGALSVLLIKCRATSAGTSMPAVMPVTTDSDGIVGNGYAQCGPPCNTCAVCIRAFMRAGLGRPEGQLQGIGLMHHHCSGSLLRTRAKGCLLLG
jgi:hypothetical protein